jgi:hypothetical protein
VPESLTCLVSPSSDKILTPIDVSCGKEDFRCQQMDYNDELKMVETFQVLESQAQAVVADGYL